jgi:hypothetical protein
MFDSVLLSLLPATVPLAAPQEATPPPTPSAQAPADAPAEDAEPEGPPPFLSPAEWDPTTPRGVVHNGAGATPGLTLVQPINSVHAHLIELDGTVVHTWTFDSAPGAWAYLLEDGSLLRAGREDVDPKFRGGGIGGRVQRLAPDSSLLWNYDLAHDHLWQHHDLEPLPNGNLLVIAWDRIDEADAVALGRDADWVGAAGLWLDTVLELEPVGSDGARVVWQWRAADHLVQDRDPALPNYGSPAEFPGRIDLNGDHEGAAPLSAAERARLAEQQRQLEALGYTGGVAQTTSAEEEKELAERREKLAKSGDVLHTNGIDYHPELDLIVLSTPEFNELWVIDHSTTTAEARGSSGGRYGRGGDLLWRWGNPKTYGHGTDSDQQLGYQHDPKWLATTDGSLRLTVFDNGGGHLSRGWSEVEELVLPFDAKRGFLRHEGEPFGPEAPAWRYRDEAGFYSAFISGAERLPSGNTLICSGAGGRIFEVTPAGETVWNYRSDLGGDVEPPDHAGKAPTFALFRAARYAPDHPGVLALLAARVRTAE